MRKIIKRATLLLALVMVFSVTCFADTTGDNGKTLPSVTVNIPAKHQIKGDRYSGKDRFSFVLTAEDDNNPMPEGSDGAEKTVTIGAGEKIDFGDITFDYPDAYYYEVSRVDKTYKGIKTDDSVYRVMIASFNDGSHEMTIWNLEDDDPDEGSKADEIVYEDIYKAPSPQTGDDRISEMMMPAVTGLVSLTAVIVILLKRRKEERNEQ